jgi:S1-C subfamily serine protease
LGWRRIVADLHTFLATGVDPQRFMRSWGDFGAESVTDRGGIRVQDIRPGGLADRIGIVDGDLLITLAGAPITTVDELLTALRVLETTGNSEPAAEWVREGALHTTG